MAQDWTLLKENWFSSINGYGEYMLVALFASCYFLLLLLLFIIFAF